MRPRFTKNERALLAIAAVYFAVLGGISAIVEPIGWFGGASLLERIGWPALVALYVLPALLIASPILRARRMRRMGGIVAATTGKTREPDYQAIRASAEKSIFIVGISMSKLSKWAKESLREQAVRVPIDILMLDPDFVDANPSFAQVVAEYIGVRDYCALIRSAFDDLRKLCIDHNAVPGQRHRMSLRAYSSMNAVSAVIVDEQHLTAAALFDVFLYHSGERRLLVHAVTTDEPDDVFNTVQRRLRDLWNASRVVV